MTSDAGPSSLAELEARLRRDLELLVLPPNKDWLEPRTHPEYGAARHNDRQREFHPGFPKIAGAS